MRRMATIPPDRARPAPAEAATAASSAASRRPAGVTAMSVFFAVGALLAGFAAISLASPGGMLEPMWRLNPRAREGFRGIEMRGALLLAVVSLACAGASAGLFRGRRWGRLLAISVLAVQLVGDGANVVLGIDRRAAVGLPVALGLIGYLFTRRVRAYFAAKASG